MFFGEKLYWHNISLMGAKSRLIARFKIISF
jgi:hypothetical protein